MRIHKERRNEEIFFGWLPIPKSLALFELREFVKSVQNEKSVCLFAASKVYLNRARRLHIMLRMKRRDITVNIPLKLKVHVDLWCLTTLYGGLGVQLKKFGRSSCAGLGGIGVSAGVSLPRGIIHIVSICLEQRAGGIHVVDSIEVKTHGNAQITLLLLNILSLTIAIIVILVIES